MTYPQPFEDTLRSPLPQRVLLTGSGLFIMLWPTWNIVRQTVLLGDGFSWWWAGLILVYVSFGAVIAAFGFATVRLGPSGLIFQNSLLTPATEVPYSHILTAEADLLGTLVRLRDGSTPILVAVPKNTLLPPLSRRLCRADLLVDYLLHRAS